MALVVRVCVVLVVTMTVLLVASQAQAQLTVGFYSETCPDAESIISRTVRDAALSSNSNVPAILLRLHFHDCFGCDGSILIDGGRNVERRAVGHQGVGGFDVIERAKFQLEKFCPGIVSCADIVALAARDSIVLTNGPFYEVPTGRRDGRASNVSMADDMPSVTDSIQQLKAKFLSKGLSEKDLVLLSAAHTIGTTACFFMSHRLYNFLPGAQADPSINPEFLSELQFRCPKNGNVNVRLAIDEGSELTFDDQILRNIRNGFAVLESDARLYDDEDTRSIINSYFGFLAPIFGPSFEDDFVESIIKMGQIGVKTVSQGEIRRVCRAFN
ncbi:hem peroxidase [Dillenia turbinata]|uniref:Peroxidase n=1 Tax=Dillenia turbinata TaxID=194707 RepID=A0AAN8Z0B4_9MAGN